MSRLPRVRIRERIDLTSPSIDDVAAAADSSRTSGKRKAPAQPQHHCELGDDSDLEIVEPQDLLASSQEPQEADHDGVRCTKWRGVAANRDLPHERSQCGRFAFVPMPSAAANKQHCAHCYCFVCEVPAAACVLWPSHCHAWADDGAKWTEAKRATQRVARAGATGSARPFPARRFAEGDLVFYYRGEVRKRATVLKVHQDPYEEDSITVLVDGREINTVADRLRRCESVA